MTTPLRNDTPWPAESVGEFDEQGGAIGYSKADMLTLLERVSEYLAQHSPDQTYGVSYNPEEDDDIQIYVRGNLLWMALHFHHEAAALQILAHGCPIEPGHYESSGSFGWRYCLVHPLEKAFSSRYVAVARAMLQQGVDLSWTPEHDSDEFGGGPHYDSPLGVTAATTPRILDFMLQAGWQEAEAWKARANQRDNARTPPSAPPRPAPSA